MRYFLELSYKGTRYNGWQKQPNAPSVQQALDESLSTLLREEISTVGAGRTDTGVHASYYVAHFEASDALVDDGSFIRKINSILPPDIAVFSATKVAETAHARFDAYEREYKYYIALRKNPFRKETAWFYSGQLDPRTMNEAAAHLLRKGDFTTFSKLHSNNKTDICEVKKAEWKADGDTLVFTIRADRFLRNMVRATVGTLADVGRGKLSPEKFRDILESRDRSLSSGSAPAQGLFLTDVLYPENIFSRSSSQKESLHR